MKDITDKIDGIFEEFSVLTYTNLKKANEKWYSKAKYYGIDLNERNIIFPNPFLKHVICDRYNINCYNEIRRIRPLHENCDLSLKGYIKYLTSFTENNIFQICKIIYEAITFTNFENVDENFFKNSENEIKKYLMEIKLDKMTKSELFAKFCK